MDTLKQIISDIPVFLNSGLTTLPLTLGGTLLIIGLFTANYAILFFLLGFLIVVPLAAMIMDFLFSWLPESWIKVSTTDICRIVIPFTTIQAPTGKKDEKLVSSAWMAMITFFIGYMFHNALKLYSLQTTDPSLTVDTNSASDMKTTNRTSQAMVALVSIVVVGLILVIFHHRIGCESLIGMILTTAVFSVGGYYWYSMLSGIGQDRLSDLFGIANRLLPPRAITNGPVACIPDPDAACDN
jgi:hypothetical protein